MDRNRLTKEAARAASDFEHFVELMNLPDQYKDCNWLERDYRTLKTHGEVYAKSLMLPEAKTLEDFFSKRIGEHSPTNTSYPGMYYFCGDTPNRPENMHDEKGRFYKEFVTPTAEVVRMVEAIFGAIRDTRSFEIIKWDNGKHLVLVHHGAVISADGWLGVI